MNTVGNILKSNRNLRNVSIENISQELKISKYILNKLENDTYTRDHEVVFYIGHLRSYCNYLELDSDRLIKKYKDQIYFNKNDLSETIAKPDFQNQSYKLFKYVPASLILIIFISFYFLFINEDFNKREYALIPDLPESYLPIIEEANLNNSTKTYKSEVDEVDVDYVSENFTTVNASSKLDHDLSDNTITLKIWS